MRRLVAFTRAASIGVTQAGFSLLGVAAIVAGGYLISVATPCLCFDVNGLMLLAGMAVVLGGAATLMWARDIAKLIVGQARKRLFQGDSQADSPMQRNQTACR